MYGYVKQMVECSGVVVMVESVAFTVMFSSNSFEQPCLSFVVHVTPVAI